MKFKKLQILIILFVCIFFKVEAQVDLPTGAAQFSMPIYTYSDMDKLSSSISLNYINGNGLKVNEVAGIVGTGWNLQAGGVITRVQRGLPDDQRRDQSLPNPMPDDYYINDLDPLYNYNTKRFPNGYLFSGFNSTTDLITNEGGYIKTSYSGTGPYPTSTQPQREFFATDREQDIFQLDYGKGVVEFVILKNLQIRVLNGSKIKVIPVIEDMLNLNILTCISKFIVTDLDGIKYTFENKELSQNCTYEQNRVPNTDGTINFNENPFPAMPSGGNVSLAGYILYPGQNPQNPNAQPTSYANIGKRTGKYTVTKWYLSEAINILSGKKISFIYENFDLEMNTTKFLTYVKAANVRISKEVVKACRLIKINYPQSNSVDFVYETYNRIDVPNQKPIREIQIKNNNTIINKFVFDYEYFVKKELKSYYFSIPENEKFYARLCLKSFQRYGSDNTTLENPYKFEYYLPDQLLNENIPPMFSLLTDHWGYYNINTIARNDPSVISFEISPDKIYDYYRIKNECQYAPLKKPNDGMAKLGIIKQITNPLGGIISYEYEQNTAYYNGQNVTNGGVRVSKIKQYDGQDHSNDITKEIKYLKSDGISSSGWGFEPHTYSQVVASRAYAQSDNSDSKFDFRVFVSSIVTATLRGIGTPSSTGGSVTLESSFYKAVIGSAIGVIIKFFTSNIAASLGTFEEETYLEYQNISYQSGNPLPMLYSRVEVLETVNNATNNGKLVTEFTSINDKPLLVYSFESPFCNEKRYLESYYGLPKRELIYDNTGFLLKESINSFDTYDDYLILSKSWMSKKHVYDVYPTRAATQTYLNGTENIIEKNYPSIINYTELKSTKERIFSKNTTGFIETVSNYTYNSNNHQLKSKSTYDSKGKLFETKYYYPQDYNLTTIPVLQSLVSNNMLNVPISTETWQTKAGNPPEMLSNSVIEFGIAANGDLKPIKSYELQTDRPIPETIIGVFNPNMLIRNSTFVRPTNETIYDVNGNPVKIKDVEGDINATTIFSAINTLPIAVISNATPDEVAYSSFEEIGELNGKVLIGGNSTNTLYTQPCPTGKNNLNLINDGTTNSNFVTIYVNVTKESILSFWSTVPNLLLNGSLQIPIISSPTIQGWTYYQYIIPANTMHINITGNGQIDEIRLYPKNAKMVTTTYELEKGKTSECDINNRITHYEYDGQQRIIKILDEKRNIIKTFEYNSKTN